LIEGVDLEARMTSAQLNQTRTSGPLSLAAFRVWLARAKPGERLRYHQGFLVCDRTAGSEQDRRRIVAVADAVVEAAAAGKVHLLQRRDGACNFAYFAIKASAASQPRGVSPSHAGFQCPDRYRAAA
jgi:hypothetical protein